MAKKLSNMAGLVDQPEETFFLKVSNYLKNEFVLSEFSYLSIFPPGPKIIIYERAGLPLPPLNSVQSVSN